MKRSRRFIDLSHTVHHGLVTYKGLPAPVVSMYLSRADSRAPYAAGTEFYIGKIELVANTGTYLNAPYHRYGKGLDLSQLPDSGFRVYAVPAKVKGLGSFPVRAFAEVARGAARRGG